MVSQIMSSKEWFIITRKDENSDPKFCHGEVSGDTLKRINAYIHVSVIHKSMDHE